MNKLRILFSSIVGNLYKLQFFCYYILNKNPRKSKRTEDDVIVSLTSYGSRVANSSPYTIFSLFRQSVFPAKIILWLDKLNWNKNNLPSTLRYLTKYGLEIKFCDDIKSYTKLIPSLNEYPKYNTITVDDDIFYSSEMLQELISIHHVYPRAICSLQFCIPTFDINHTIKPYKEWKEYHIVTETMKIDTRLIFPQGFGGILYPTGIFDESVNDIRLANKLCPTADDVWFYCMGLKNNVNKQYIINSKTRYYLLDMFRQLILKDRLRAKNVKEIDQNVIQMKKVLDYYQIKLPL